MTDALSATSTTAAGETEASRATWRDYVTLTKPKVISLLLLTTLGAMFIAQGGFPGWVALLGVAFGGYMSAGAAGVFNMVYDADIDVRMRRTATRPSGGKTRPGPREPRIVDCQITRDDVPGRM